MFKTALAFGGCTGENHLQNRDGPKRPRRKTDPLGVATPEEDRTYCWAHLLTFGKRDYPTISVLEAKLFDDDSVQNRGRRRDLLNWTSPSVSSFRIAFRKESVPLSTPVLTTLLLPEVRVLGIKMLEPLLVVV